MCEFAVCEFSYMALGRNFTAGSINFIYMLPLCLWHAVLLPEFNRTLPLFVFDFEIIFAALLAMCQKFVMLQVKTGCSQC